MAENVSVKLQVDTAEFDAKTKRSIDSFVATAQKGGAAAGDALSGGVERFSTDFPAKVDKTGASLVAFTGKALAAGTVVGLLARELFQAATIATQFADDLDAAATQANINVERYQTLTEGLRKMELSTSQTDQVFRRLSNTLGEVQSDTAAKGVSAALDAMGVKSRILNGEITTTDGLFDAIAGSAGKFRTEAEFTAAVVDVLGRGVGVQLAAALRDGGKALFEQEQAFRSAGAVIDEEYVKTLAEANERIDSFTTRARNTLFIWASDTIKRFEAVGQAIREVGVLELTLTGGARAQRIYRGPTKGGLGRGGGYSIPSDTPTPSQPAKEESDTKKLAATEKARTDAQRAAEKAREAAYQREIDAIRQALSLEEERLDRAKRLNGEIEQRVDSELQKVFGAFNPQSSISTDVGPDVLQDVVTRELEKAGFGVAKSFEDRGLVAAQAIAQAFGGKVGGEVSKIAGVLRGVSTGDFTSLGGQAGGILTLLTGGKADSAFLKGVKEIFEPATEGLSKALDGIGAELGLGAGGLGSSLLAGAGIGAAVSKGSIEGSIGGAIGGAAGQALGTAIGGPLGGAIGQIAGSILGGAVGGLFVAPKKGSVTVSGQGGAINVGNATGNSASRRANAEALGTGLADTLQSIVDELGGTLGNFAVSVGQRDKVFSVDPTGRGYVSKKYGVTQFATAEEALEFAIQDALKDGALQGVSQTIQNALTRASSVEKGLENALTIKGIADQLKALDDPLGAAIDDLDDKYRDLEKTFRDAGATAEELAGLERLYNEERKKLTEESVETLKAFQRDLNIGGNSPLSLTDQRRNAEAEFAKFEADIRAGRDFDQSAFVQAGQSLLDIERQISGGTADYFAQFDRVQGLTNKAIGDIENATAIRDNGLFAQKTAEATQQTAASTAALLNATNQTNILLTELNSRLGSAGGGGFVGAGSAQRGFVRAA